MAKEKCSVEPSKDHMVPVPTSLEQGKQTGSDVIAEVPKVSEKHLSSRVRAQRARRERERELSCESVKKSKTITSNSALEQQTGNNTPSNIACSKEMTDKIPSNIALAHAQTDAEKDELLAKKKDHSSCEVKNTVEKTDTDKTVDESAVNDGTVLKRILAQRARRQREKKELQLKKPSVSSSAVKNMVTSDQIKQHLPFSPNITARNGFSQVPAAPSHSHSHLHEKNPITRQKLTSSEPNLRPSSFNPSRSFTLGQPPIRVHHFITSKNQINMNRNPLQSFDTSSVMKHIHMVHSMSGMKRKNPETEASKCKMDMGKCHMGAPPKLEIRPEVPICLQRAPPKPEIRPEVPICLQPRRGNLPLLSTPQSHLIGKQSRPEHPVVNTLGEKVAAAIRRSLTRREISQRTRRERERAEATRRRRRPVLFSKQSMAQRARRDRERKQAAIASSSTCSLPAEEQGNSTKKQFEKIVLQGSNLHILPPNKGASRELGSSIPAEHLTSAVCVNSPPQSSVSQGSNLHILPPNKGVSSESGSSIPVEHLTSVVCVNSPPQSLVSEGSNLNILPPNKGVSDELGASIPAEHLTSAVRVNSPPRTSVSQNTRGARERAAAQRSRPVLFSKRSIAQRARKERQRQQAAIASSTTCSLPAEEQSVGATTAVISSNCTIKASSTQTERDSTQKQFEKMVPQGSNLHILPSNDGVSSEFGSSIPAEHLTSAVCVNSPPRSSVSEGSNLHILPPNKGVSSELGSSIPAKHLTSAVCVNSPPQSTVSEGSNLHILPANEGVISELGSSVPAEHLTSAVCVNFPPRSSVSQGARRARERTEATQRSRPVLFSKRSIAQRVRRDRQRQQAAIASSSTCSLPVEEQGKTTKKQFEKIVSQGSNLHRLPPNKDVSSELGSSIPAEHLTRVVCVNSPPGSSVLQGSNLHILPPNKGLNSELDSSIPAEHLTRAVCVNSPPQTSVSQGSNLHILPPNKRASRELGSSIPAEHPTSAVCVNSPPRSSVSHGNILHILPPNKGVCSKLGSSIPAEHLTSAVFVNSPRSLAGGSTASSVHSGPRVYNLVSGGASSLVNISSLGMYEVTRLSSPSVGFGKAFDRGSKIKSVSSQSLSSDRTSFGTAYPSSSSHGPASASPDMTKRTLGIYESSGTGRITQARLSPLGNRFLLPQLAKHCKMRGSTNLNNNGKQWRLGGSSFKVPKELSVGAATAVISSRGSKASPTQAQGNFAPKRVQKKVLQASNLQILAANHGMCSDSGSSVPAEHLADADIVNSPARSLSGGPTASSVHSGQGPDNLISGDASYLVNVCSLKKAELMRVSSPSGNMGLGKGIDRSCKFESVASQSRNRIHLSPDIAFHLPSTLGPASAASDMVKKTLGTVQSGTGGITQPLLSTLSNGIPLLQLGGSCKALGLTDSNSDGEQWRPGGSSFQDPTKVVQQRMDSTLDACGAARSDKCLTGHTEEEPRKKALSDLKNVNLIAVPSSPGNSILEDSGTVADASMVSAVNLSVNECHQSPILNQIFHVENEHLVCNNKISEEELHRSNKTTDCGQDHRGQPSPLRQAQTDKSNKASFSSPPIKSLTEPSSAPNDRENTSGVSRPGGFRKMNEEYWKARFLRLQDHLKHCDDTSDEEYIQRIQCSSSNIGGGQVLELKGRAMKLLLEEGCELMRVKHLNVLGSSVVPLTKSLETEN